MQNDGQMLARYFTYFTYQKKAKNYQISFANITGKKTFAQWEKYFNVLSKICKKYNIDPKEYVYNAVMQQGYTYQDIPKLLDPISFQRYAEQIKINEQYQKIYSYFQKSANYIVDECLKNSYGSCKEFLKRQILHNTLAEKMLAGKISIYYLATIKNIREIVSKMDPISRDTFETLVERADKLNSDVQDAFLRICSRKVNPIQFTDDLLFKRMSNKV